MFALCPGLDGAVLAPRGDLDGNDRATCTFVLDTYLQTYAGKPRDNLLSTASVTVGDGTESVTVSDATIVRNDHADEVDVALVAAVDVDGDGVFATSGAAARTGTAPAWPARPASRPRC